MELVGDASSLNRAFGQAGSAGSNWSRKLGAAGKVAVLGLAGAGVAAVGLGAKMVSMASDAAEVDSKFRVVFGQQMPRLTANIDKFAAATGASRFEMRQQVADMGALLQPILKNRKAAGDMSVDFVKLATDLASFNNVPTADALDAIRSGLVGEAEPLRRFGVLLNENAIKQEAYRLGIAKTGDELTEQQKVQARASLIMKQTALAQGDAERTSGSFANQMKRLKNSLKDTGTEIGMKLLPFALKLVDAFNQVFPMVMRLGTRAFRALGEAIAPVIEILEGLGFALFGIRTENDLGKMGQQAIDAGKVIKEALGAAWQWIQQNIVPIILELKDIWVAAVTKIAATLKAHEPELRRIWERVGAVIRTLASVILPILRVALVEVLPRAIGFAITAIDKVTSAFGKVIEKVKSVINWIRDQLGKPEVRKAIRNLVAPVEAVVDIFKRLVNWLKSAWDWLQKLVGKVWNIAIKIDWPDMPSPPKMPEAPRAPGAPPPGSLQSFTVPGPQRGTLTAARFGAPAAAAPGGAVQVIVVGGDRGAIDYFQGLFARDGRANGGRRF